MVNHSNPLTLFLPSLLVISQSLFHFSQLSSQLLWLAPFLWGLRVRMDFQFFWFLSLFLIKLITSFPIAGCRSNWYHTVGLQASDQKGWATQRAQLSPQPPFPDLTICLFRSGFLKKKKKKKDSFVLLLLNSSLCEESLYISFKII